jgi:hypothetical protein
MRFLVACLLLILATPPTWAFPIFGEQAIALNREARQIRDGNTYRFYQGGYAEGAFVFGFFRGRDLNGNGLIESQRMCATPTCGTIDSAITRTADGIPIRTTDVDRINDLYADQVLSLYRNEVTDFALYFSGNSLAEPFLLRGLEVLTSRSYLWDDGDQDSGLFYSLGSGAIGGENGYCEPSDCPGVLVAQTWDFFTEPYLEGWFDDWVRNGPRFQAGGFESGSPATSSHTRVSIPTVETLFLGAPGQGDATTDVISVVRVFGPNSILLLAIGLAGIGFARRKIA